MPVKHKHLINCSLLDFVQCLEVRRTSYLRKTASPTVGPRNPIGIAFIAYITDITCN